MFGKLYKIFKNEADFIDADTAITVLNHVFVKNSTHLLSLLDLGQILLTRFLVDMIWMKTEQLKF